MREEESGKEDMDGGVFLLGIGSNRSGMHCEFGAKWKSEKPNAENWQSHRFLL
uniref:Uncharacterized protein n=1 Tax=Setaria viridis TaxID=4556 RepID=A0A4U6W1L6_SETVI|nr:hypothetical protein SEVIR_2G433150v2 [Setaria viridis]